ncbi:MAG: penicillin-binding protein 2 [Planctomycetes bacterium]|nr:penicillin-binding protein 2 [Planctomycetota bacterium]MBU1518859.1 penicillin-binding protein 2 [Planctomycetota bacterium]MBU2596964.1 penicillin-binding protein 2 [Planctomycetota bacterium]
MRNKTALIFLSLIGIGFIGIAVRCFYLQYYRNDYYQQISLKAQRSNFTQQPQRGAILDCRGRTLAASYVSDTVFAEPRAIADIKKTAEDLAGIINITPIEISKTVLTARNAGYAPIVSDIRLTDAQRKQVSSLQGIGIESKWKRYYPLGAAAAHSVGFIGTDGQGLAGLELQYDKILRGAFGISTFFSDAARRPVGLKSFGAFAQDGSDIVLTLDSVIQEFAYSALKKQVAEFQAQSGVAIVMDPCSGAILAFVSLPDFNPSNLKNADQNSLGNHILSDPFEPGSIIKPIIAAWAIETNSINPDDTIFCGNGRYSGKGFGTIGEYHEGGYGNLSISGILAHSSNIGMAKIGQKMGAAKLYEGLKLFGFGRKTGIDLPGEDSGVVWPLKFWTGYSIARVPFGHEFSATSMQMAGAYCTLANHGRPVKPHLVKAVVNSDGNEVKLQEPPQTAAFVISEKTARWIIEKALVQVVQEGTGRRIAIKDRQVWGKTGTANIADRSKGGYDEKNYVASFIGGCPAKNPAMVILVSIRKPNRSLGKGYTGGSVALPVAKEIIEKTLAYLKL